MIKTLWSNSTEVDSTCVLLCPLTFLRMRIEQYRYVAYERMYATTPNYDTVNQRTTDTGCPVTTFNKSARVHTTPIQTHSMYAHCHFASYTMIVLKQTYARVSTSHLRTRRIHKQRPCHFFVTSTFTKPTAFTLILLSTSYLFILQ